MDNDFCLMYNPMKIKLLLLFSVVFFASSCKTEEKPAQLLPFNQMTDLLYDLTIENSRQSMYIQADSAQFQVLPSAILQKYGLDSAAFVKQHRYYIEHGEQYTAMFDTIQKRLQKKIQHLEQLPDVAQDTLR